jgi:hypothetical protein
MKQSFETHMHLGAVDCILLKVVMPLCPRYAGLYGASCLFSIRVSVQALIDLSSELHEGFQKETGDSHVENVRADGFHIILKQQSPLLVLHEAMEKVRLLVPVSCK